MRCLIYDYETLSVVPQTAPILAVAGLEFDPDHFLRKHPYTYDELWSSCHYMKFDVEHQIKELGKTIDKETYGWWTKQSAEAKRVLKPSPHDVRLEKIVDFFEGLMMGEGKVERVYTRGVKLEVITTDYLMRSLGKKSPIEHWQMRETKSFLEGFLFGSDLENRFIPEGLEKKFVAHDPRDDIVMDVMRMQTCVRQLYGD